MSEIKIQEERKLQASKNKKTGQISFSIGLPYSWVVSSELEANKNVVLTYTGTTIVMNLK